MDRRLKRGIIAVFTANMINVVFSLATNFLLPKYLSIESYAGIKTFQLYVSYVGLLHFGYVDGMYLKYGGKDLKTHLSTGFASNYATMHTFQAVVTAVITIGALFSRDWILILFAVSIFPQNLNNYFKFLYQATGEFSLYGRAMNLSTISTFVVNMFLLFLLRQDNHLHYIVCYVALYYSIWIFLEYRFRRKRFIPKTKLFDWNELVENIRSGFLLTLGNLASMLLTSMDRWFVKLLLETVAFAQYSFAVSVENFLNLAVTPVTTTLYNYFCRETQIEKHRSVLRYILVFATVLPAAAFPVRFILETFLVKYIESSTVVFVLFSAQMFYIIIRSVFVNLYKVQRKQRIYFIKLVFILVIGFVFNVVCFQFLHRKEAFAIGTLLSAVVWFFITLPDFPQMKPGWNEMLYLFAELGLFLLIGLNTGAVTGLLLYVAATIVLMLLLMRSTLAGLLRNAGQYLKR